MTTSTLQHTTTLNHVTTKPSPDRLGLPPPREFDLMDGGRVVGWVATDVVGFRGFADEAEAAHAAWVAYRTLARRLARTHGIRPLPIDIEPITLEHRGHDEIVISGGRKIATLVRPGVASRSGSDTFGFEIRVPAPADELQLRAMAYLMYRTLRKSGLRWALWQPAGERARSVPIPLSDSARAKENRGDGNVTERPRQHPRRRRAGPWRRAAQPGAPVNVVGWGAVGVLSVVLLVLALLVPRELGIGLGAVGFAGLFVFRLSAMYGDRLPPYRRVSMKHGERTGSRRPPA
jgi:hypothetical protein